MKPIVLIHGYSAESKETDPVSIESIYGTLPKDLRTIYSDTNIVKIDLSRWISLDDGLTIDDISRAFDMAIRTEEYSQLLKEGFDVIIHSTGALVIRNWLKKFSPAPSPLGNLIYLAGVNLGSGWAHIGKGQLAKWGRFVFQFGTERGVRMLDALELASEEAIDLHLYFTNPEHYPDKKYKVLEHVIIGSQADVKWFEAPIRYAKEDGSDGVVRVAASNLNFLYCHLRPTKDIRGIAWEDLSTQIDKHLNRKGRRKMYYEVSHTSIPGLNGRAELPFAIPYECAHSGEEMGIVTGRKCREQVLKIIKMALTSDCDNWRSRVTQFHKETQTTYEKVKELQKPPFWPWSEDPRNQYDKHAQVIFRLRDQDNRPVTHYDIFFSSLDINRKNSKPMSSVIEYKHINKKSPNVILFYIRVERFDENQKKWVNQLNNIGDTYLEITATEPETDRIKYLPLRFKITKSLLKQWLQPHRTTIFDIELYRQSGPDVFIMTKKTKNKSNRLK